MKFTWLCAGALIATASASAQTTRDAPLPSEKEYFERAADVRACYGEQPAKLPELEALRTQTLDYYRTKLSKADSGSDPASADAIRALEANVIPAEALKAALSMKRIAADWAGWCQGVPANIRYAQARHDLAMATIDWPGAKPLDQARKAVAAFEVHATNVMVPRLPPPPSSDAASVTPPIVCTSGKVNVLLGTEAAVGARYSTATGLTVVTPANPGQWTVARCDSGRVALTHRDPATQGVLAAMAADVGIAPWMDEYDFEERVRHIVEQSTAAGIHLKIDTFQAIMIDGRPCVDIRRSGSIDFLLTPDGRRLAGPFESRDFLRACHLRDRRGPDAATLIEISGNGLADTASFDVTAKAFLDGITLPIWMR
jgi:hypothetical protein